MRYLQVALFISAMFGGCFTSITKADAQSKKVLRAGIIGLDTSHVVAFTKVLNDPKAPPELSGVKVVAAFPGGSPDVEASRTRVAGFTKTLKEDYGVKIVASIDALLPLVDVVLLESVDGRPHLKQVIPVLKAGKPVFIDKPVAGSLADAIQIFELAKEYKVPCFSSSSLRFSPGIIGARNSKKIGKVLGCSTFSPCSLEPHHPDLFWYGVHGVEILFTVMGTGCEKVSRTQTKDYELVVGTWKGGRIGTFRGLRRKPYGYGGMVFGSKRIEPLGSYTGYKPLLVEIVKFFKTGEVPVRAEETIEMFAFMEAADESKRRGGLPVTIARVMEKARKTIAKRLQ
ncbi:MAG: Gfo/Idh/MocA family protein [Gemmataceae bacterium]